MRRDEVDEIVNTLIKIKESKNPNAVKDYLALFTRNLIRFIDTEAILSEVV